MTALPTGGVTRRIRGLAIYDREGTAPGVVCVHGAMDRGAAFLRLARHLPGPRLVRYDRRGYGRSVARGSGSDDRPADRQGDGLADQVDDLLAILDAEPGPVVLVGHSFGGVLALAAAEARADRVAGVLVYEPPLPWEPWWSARSAGGDAVRAADGGGPGAAAEAFMRRIVGDTVWDGLPETTKAARRAEGPALLAELRALRTAARPPFSLPFRCPTIVACGTRADDRHRRAADELAAGSGRGVALVDGAGHGGHTSHPAALAALVQDLLASAGADHSAGDPADHSADHSADHPADLP